MTRKKWNELPWHLSTADDKVALILLMILNITLILCSYAIIWFATSTWLSFLILAFLLTAGWIFFLEAGQEHSSDKESKPDQQSMITFRRKD